MKKIFKSLAAIAIVAFAAACSNEMIETPPVDGEEAIVSFALATPGLQTRAVADGTTVDKVVCCVYNDAGVLVTDDTISKSALGTFDYQVRLVTGQTYSFAFWAYKAPAEGSTAIYNFNKAEKSVRVENYTTATNDESRDAFYAYIDSKKISGSLKEKVELYRPFAQLNFGVEKADVEAAKALGVTVAKSSLSLKHLGNTLNLADGTVSGDVDASFTAANLLSEDLTVNSTAYGYVSMNYVLVGKSQKTTTDAELTIYNASDEAINTISLPNVPLQGNYRTNIIGKLYTSQADFQIVVDPAFAAEEYNVERISIPAGFSGTYYLPDTKEDLLLNIEGDCKGENIITIAYNTNAETSGIHPGNVTINAGNYEISGLNINLGQSHVVTYGGTYGSFVAITSTSTLVLDKTTTINTSLLVKGGSVEVAGTVKEVKVDKAVGAEATVKVAETAKVEDLSVAQGSIEIAGEVAKVKVEETVPATAKIVLAPTANITTSMTTTSSAPIIIPTTKTIAAESDDSQETSTGTPAVTEQTQAKVAKIDVQKPTNATSDYQAPVIELQDGATIDNTTISGDVVKIESETVAATSESGEQTQAIVVAKDATTLKYALENGREVKLGAAIAGNFTVAKDVTLDLNGQTLSATSGNVITIQSGVSLTLKDASEAHNGNIQIANDAYSVDNTNGTLIVEGISLANVLSADGVRSYYVADEAALRAALADTETNAIVLNEGIELSKTIVLANGSKAVIDLNGNKLSAASTATYKDKISIFAVNGANLTVKNGFLGDDAQKNFYGIYSGSTSSVVMIEDVTYGKEVTYAFNGSGGKFEANNSKFYGWLSGWHQGGAFTNCEFNVGKAFYAAAICYGNTTFEGCKFFNNGVNADEYNGPDADGYYRHNYVVSGYEPAESISFVSCKFIDASGIESAISSANHPYHGKSTCPEGWGDGKNEASSVTVDGVKAATCVVTAVSTVAELNAAFAAGGNIKLMNDLTVSESIWLYSGKQATLDLNGKTINISGCRAIIVDGGDLTVTGNGKMLAANKTGDNNSVLNLDGGTLTIENGYYEGANVVIGVTDGTAYINNATLKALEGGCCILSRFNNSVVNINGMTFTCGGDDPKGPGACWAQDGGIINIYGGTYNAAPLSNKTHQLEVVQANYCLYAFQDYDGKSDGEGGYYWKGYINVYGGTFLDFNPAKNYAGNSFVADGYEVVQDGTTYTVRKASAK